ncbi:thiosulfate dehydrogenase [quinone] large subunit [Rhizobiales bacterium GAS191]|nr:thiosulfate dehydrogenase [quinone] large subunit [Rhizobiales bacterium GAS191]
MSATSFERYADRATALTEGQRTEDQRAWRVAALALLSTRVIQGFIYWGGGSRRFIYAPSKLNPDAHTWMANKFQTAMPGALFGTDHVISFMLQHFYLLYAGVILFSAAELIVGAMLMTGYLTRFAALVSMGFSALLMAMFGWQGATCIDEWTMAACNLAMGATLLLGGSGAYSLDNVMLGRKPALAARPWFRWMSGSLPLPQTDVGFRNLALGVLSFVLVFNIATYSYYRGSVLTPFHSGPVSPTRHHLALSAATLLPDGSVRFHVYLDAGTPEAPVHVIAADLLVDDKQPIAHWDAGTLSALPKTAFANDYAYNKFAPGPFGIRAPMGAAATVTLEPPRTGSTAGARFLRLTDVDGQSFSIALNSTLPVNGPAERSTK